MTIIELNRRYYTVPTAWNELSGKQLIGIMECLFVTSFSSEQALLKLLKILTGMNYWQFFRQKPTEMAEYLYLTEFLLQQRTELTKQLLPVLFPEKPEEKRFYGPADEISNLLMGEFIFSEAFFMQWCDDKNNMEPLNELCAVLYRPAKKNYDHKRNPDGDPREEYNGNLCHYRAVNEVKKWPLAVKLAIATWYDACRWKMVDDNPDVFAGGGEPGRYGLVSVMRKVAEGGVLGDFKSVEKTHVNLVMIELNESIADAKAQEKAMKKK